MRRHATATEKATPFTTIHGIGVDAQASTPYNVATGGTDFSDTYFGVNHTYWSGTNSPTHGSARSYIPEIPWNSTCASELIAHFNGFASYLRSGRVLQQQPTSNL